jgi:hypothetical protein
MTIKKDYVLKTIGDELIIVPVKDEAVRFNGIITVNKTAAFLFQLLQEEDLSVSELTHLVTEKYDIKKETAQKDVEAFIKKCKKNGLLNE